MYNLAGKLFAPLANPLALALLLLLAALVVWRRRRLGVWLAAGAVTLLLAGSVKIVERALVRSLEDQYRDVGLDVPVTQALVVLGGAMELPAGSHQASHLGEASDRLLTTLRLLPPREKRR